MFESLPVETRKQPQDRTPAAWHLAVDNKSTRTRFYIDYPIIKPHFIQSDRYQAGIEEAEIDGRSVKIYDRERTICEERIESIYRRRAEREKAIFRKINML